jgi:hypothetical protein
MTRNETAAIMAVLEVAYPRFYASQSREEKKQALSLWAEMFAGDPAEIVTAAVKSFIATDIKGFPPHIGAIKDHVVKVTSPPEKSELEAWAEVKKAMSNSNYNEKKEFDNLDPIIQRIVGSPSQLREWAMVDTETLDSVISSNFQRSFRAISKTNRDNKALPSVVSGLVKQIANGMAIESKAAQAPIALPVSVEATVNRLKEEIGEIAKRDMPKQLSPDEFEKRRAEILADLVNTAAG